MRKSTPYSIRIDLGSNDWFSKTLARTHKTPTQLFNQILRAYIQFERDGFLDPNGDKLAKQEKEVKAEIAKKERLEKEIELVRAKSASRNNPYKKPVVDWGSSEGGEIIGDLDQQDGFYNE